MPDEPNTAGRRWVSRAGEKMDHALSTFELDVTGLRCADFGCSTVDDYFCKGGKLRNNAANSFTKGEVDVAKYKADIKMLRENGGVKMPDTTPKVKKA